MEMIKGSIIHRHAMPAGMAWLFAMLLVCSCAGHSPSDNARGLHREARDRLDSRDYPGAVRTSLLLLDSAENTGDRHSQGDAHTTLADAYRAVYNLPAARRHRMAAAACFEGCDSATDAFYAYLDLAGEYSHEDNDSAYIVMESARALLPAKHGETRLQYQFIYADICRVRGDFHDALRHIRAISRDWLRDIITAEDSVHLGEIYHRNAMPDSAAPYFTSTAAADNIQYWECMAERHEASGDLAAALEARKNMQDLEFDKSSAALANSLEYVERTHYARKAASEREKRELLVAAMLWCAAAIVIGALVWLTLLYGRRARRYKTESDMKDVVMIDAKADMSPGVGNSDTAAKKDTAAGTQDNAKWIYVILDFYMSRLNDISREYFRTADEQGRREIEAEFKQELKSLREGDIFSEIEERVNDRHDGVMRHIRSDFPRLNEQYLRLMLCSLAGLSSQSTCLLLSVEKGNYYVMWTRLRAKIRLCQSERRALYESLFLSK